MSAHKNRKFHVFWDLKRLKYHPAQGSRIFVGLSAVFICYGSFFTEKIYRKKKKRKCTFLVNLLHCAQITFQPSVTKVRENSNKINRVFRRASTSSFILNSEFTK